MKLLWLTLAGFVSAALPLASQVSGKGVSADWREPGGSVIAIAPCGAYVCAKLVELSHSAPALTDVHNPDAKLRSRALCGLTIGTGFRLSDPSHAEGGKLYDPKSGKIYKGSMVSEGDTLHLRGYVGLKAFGRTQDWVRTDAPTRPCK